MPTITVTETFPMPDVLAAVCAAQRVNGSYIRETTTDYNTKVVTTANKVLAYKFLTETPEVVTDEDKEQAEKITSYLQGWVMKLLSGKITSFEKTVLDFTDKKEVEKFGLGLASSLPSIYERAIAKQSVEDRLAACEATYVGTIDTKVVLTAEVVRTVYSQQYGCYFITLITDSNHRVFFSYKEALEVGSTIKIAGRIKAHRSENTTQITRAKITKI